MPYQIHIIFMLTLQSSKARIVCLLIFKVNQDSPGDVILSTSQVMLALNHEHTLHILSKIANVAELSWADGHVLRVRISPY